MPRGSSPAAISPGPDLVPYKLSICGLLELGDFVETGVTHVISVLDPAWPEPPPLRRFGPHERFTLYFHDEVLPSPGVDLPEPNDIKRLLEIGRYLAGAPVGHLLVHCHVGQSRSTAAAVILLAQNHPGREADAFAAVARVRERCWPNSRMIAMADRMMRRNGRLILALRQHYALMAQRFPEMIDLIRDTGRTELTV
jgi:predicted protein tyrosine phosphatase